MVCREIETPAYTATSQFSHRLRYPFSSADRRHCIHWTPAYKYIYQASLHCRGSYYLNISIYICLYLIRLRQTNRLGYKAALWWHPKVTAHTKKRGAI